MIDKKNLTVCIPAAELERLQKLEFLLRLEINNNSPIKKELEIIIDKCNRSPDYYLFPSGIFISHQMSTFLCILDYRIKRKIEELKAIDGENTPCSTVKLLESFYDET